MEKSMRADTATGEKMAGVVERNVTPSEAFFTKNRVLYNQLAINEVSFARKS